MSLFRSKESTGNWWIDHSLSLVLLAILVVMTAFSMLSGYQTWQAEELQLSFWVWYSYEWLTSTLADAFGVLLIVLLSKWFFERHSNENSDDAALKKKAENSEGLQSSDE